MPFRAARGLTLIELMVTLAVAIVLLAIGIPAFQGVIANSRAASFSNGLVSVFTLARTEAMGRGLPVSVCPKNAADRSGQAMSTTCGTSANWANGWLVFTDPDGIGVFGSGEELIRNFRTPGRPAAVSAKYANGDNVASVRFDSSGMQNNGAGSPPSDVNILVVQSEATAGSQRCMIISPVGQIRIERKATCP
jgi:type IV fimbrial biogenesis protein FimT